MQPVTKNQSCKISELCSSKCGPVFTVTKLQTLEDLDAVYMKLPGKQTKISWMILSRLGINYVNASASKWTICPDHKREYLDVWRVENGCCYPDHKSRPVSPLNCMVSLVMSLKILQTEGKVLPISGKICQQCKSNYDKKFGPVTGEKVVIIVPKCSGTVPMMSSNLVIKQEPTEVASSDPLEFLDASKAVDIKREVVDEPVEEDITIKQENMETDPEEQTESPKEAEPGKIINQSNQASESEDESASKVSDNQSDISDISVGSDNDPTWDPKKKKDRALTPDSDDLQLVEEDKTRRKKKSSCGKSNSVSKRKCEHCNLDFSSQKEYKHHLRSKAHEEMMEDEELQCMDCCIAFKDKNSRARHMFDEHNEGDHPFYCKVCKVHLKNEGSFKSHNSKMHVERRDKTYYCRECDETFPCKLLHQEHIKIHKTWHGDGLQCKICGKVFANNQTLAYSKHFKTHDVGEEKQLCSCIDCTLSDTEEILENEDEAGVNRGEKRKTSTDQGNRKAAKYSSDTDASIDDSLDDENNFFVCGVCSNSFAEPEDLEEHVKENHKITNSGQAKDNEANDNGEEKEVEEIEHEMSSPSMNKEVTSASVETEVEKPKVRKPMPGLRPLTPPPQKLSKPSADKNDVDRNWAAEFGYGNNAMPSKQSGELLNKMKLMFKGSEASEENDDDDLVYRTRGFKGTAKASPQKAPRTLSKSSRQTRKRMDELLKRARDFMKKRAKSGRDDEVLSTEGEIVAEEESEEESFDEEEDDGLLIPLENGWVCEKKLNEETKSYTSHFWSPDGKRHNSLTAIRAYGERMKLKLDMKIFEKAENENPSP